MIDLKKKILLIEKILIFFKKVEKSKEMLEINKSIKIG